MYDMYKLTYMHDILSNYLVDGFNLQKILVYYSGQLAKYAKQWGKTCLNPPASFMCDQLEKPSIFPFWGLRPPVQANFETESN